MQRLSNRDVTRVFGCPIGKLRGGKPGVARVPLALSLLPESLSVTDIELLAVHQTPSMLAKVAAMRVARLRARMAMRAKLAGELLRVGQVAHPGKRFSWRDAALAAVAQSAHPAAQETPGTSIATNGSGRAGDAASVEPGASESVGREVWDKRRLRGAERARVFAELRAARVVRGTTQGGGGTGGGAGAPVPPKRRASARVYSPPLENPTNTSVLDAQSDSAQGGSHGHAGGVASASGPGVVGSVSGGRGHVGEAEPGTTSPVMRLRFQRHDGSYFKPTTGRPKSVKQEVLAAPMEELPADFVFPPPPSVLDVKVTREYTEVMVDEPAPVVVDGKCPECGMRLQRGWCGRCRVRHPEGE